MEDDKRTCTLKEGLWKRYHAAYQGREKEFYGNQLIVYYMPVCVDIAEAMKQMLPHHVELDDLISSGTFGLMDAIDKFDPNVGVKFETYCSPRIKGAILDELRSMEVLPRNVIERESQIRLATNVLGNQLGRKPRISELIKELVKEEYSSNPTNPGKPLKMSPEKKAELILKDSALKAVFSLYTDSPEHACKEENQEENRVPLSLIGAIINAKSPNPVIEAEKREMLEFCRQKTQELEPNERAVIDLYYLQERTQEQISKFLKMSTATVSSRRGSGLYKLRKKMPQFCEV